MLTCFQNKDNLTSNIIVGIFAVAWFAGGFYWLSTMPKKHVVVYNCELSETSPDFPQEAREACRIKRAESGRF